MSTSAATAGALAAAPARVRRPFPTRPVAFGALGLAVLLVVAFLGTNVYASLAQRDLARRWDEAYAGYRALDPVARSGLTYRPGDPVARLHVPAMGLDAVVVEGALPSLMRRAPGHLPSSAIPGENGVAFITGNRFAFGGFFQRVGRLEVGDRISVQSAIGETTYTVTEVRVVPASSMDLSTDSTRQVLVLFAGARMCCSSDRIVVRAIAGEGM